MIFPKFNGRKLKPQVLSYGGRYLMCLQLSVFELDGILIHPQVNIKTVNKQAVTII